MKNTQDLLANKHVIYYIAPSQSVQDAAALMSDKRIGGLLVMDGDNLVGIITERDFMRKTHADSRPISEIPVSDIMVTDVQCASLSDTVTDCLEIMTKGRFRHLPVKEGDTIKGVLSIGDLVKATIKEQATLIQQPEQFIKS